MSACLPGARHFGQSPKEVFTFNPLRFKELSQFYTSCLRAERLADGGKLDFGRATDLSGAGLLKSGAIHLWPFSADRVPPVYNTRVLDWPQPLDWSDMPD